MPDPSARLRTSGWQSVLLIAVTYVYFLIFAQFGFLKRLAECHIGEQSLAPVMAAMALGGVLSSLFGQRLLVSRSAAFRLRLGLLGCAASAAASLVRLHPVSAALVAILIGISLGLLTVTLVAHLPRWTGAVGSPLWRVGLGTGIGYFICNVPSVFEGTPATTALVGGGGCLLAAVLCGETPGPDRGTLSKRARAAPQSFWAVLLAFTALVWLDSAAFFIIQSSPLLKSGTWEGSLHLWRNGAIHLLAALLGAWLLIHRRLPFTLLAAFGCLAAACLLLHNVASVPFAALFYPAGVSLYSVALVAFPSLLLQARSSLDREQKTGLVYAIAGWFGSAMGIGMGQHLHRVPTTFVLTAGVAMVACFSWKVLWVDRAPLAAALLLTVGAWGLYRVTLHPASSTLQSHEDLIAAGRRVYIAEGCIHCHSQYVRPNSPQDVRMWGPASDVESIRYQRPPLIGNRRQGPDLSEVGGRRSLLWLRMHFANPRDVSYRSIMPSYAYLFAAGRGEALIAYMSSLKSANNAPHLQRASSSWSPQADGNDPGQDKAGALLFQHFCATCHVAGGRARSRWASSFRILPPDILTAPLPQWPRSAGEGEAPLKLARVIKFGIPGTDMPGHEYLPDRDIVALAAWLSNRRADAGMSSR